MSCASDLSPVPEAEVAIVNEDEGEQDTVNTHAEAYA